MVIGLASDCPDRCNWQPARHVSLIPDLVRGVDQMRSRRLKMALAVTVAATLVAACAGADTSPATNPGTSEAAPAETSLLEQRAFVTVELTTGDDRLPDRAAPLPGMIFNDPSDVQVGTERGETGVPADADFVLSWRGACNQTEHHIRAAAGRLELIDPDRVVSTERYCDPDEEVWDAWFTDFILGSPQWHLDGDRLRLTDGTRVVELEEDPTAHDEISGIPLPEDNHG
ncbi:META domain-containing protein [Nitriliruptoraceae bacterium ZYF776]|nr:META domain-containing protein [Profundirhabdus halotolerans]